MMHINFQTLTLTCKQEKEVLDLDYQVIFFHGEISSGKSSIARLISFALGGKLEKTTAIKQELVSVSLELGIGVHKVLLERDLVQDSQITASWIDEDNHSYNIVLPVTGGVKPVWADTVFNVSDLIFYLLDINVLRVPASKNREEAGLVRLSIRNFLWFCYLDQSKLDSSFFRQEDSSKARNSREVLRYILQYSTQQLLELNERLFQYRRRRQIAVSTATGLREFLRKFGYSTESEISRQVEITNKRLRQVREERKQMEGGFAKETHTSDVLRSKITTLIADISQLENAVVDLETRISQQESLRAELIASKFKLAKSLVVVNVFQNVAFDNCPDCGTNLQHKHVPDGHCTLCGTPKGVENPTVTQQSDFIQVDLNERVKELEESIDLHKKSLTKARRDFRNRTLKREELDEQLKDTLKSYESTFLSNVRRLDQYVATYTERAKGLLKLKKMPQEISSLDEEAARLFKNESLVKEQIFVEQQKVVNGEILIKELQTVFLQTLLDVGVPGVTADDKIDINFKTFEVQVWPKGESALHWNFYSAGSGGKKTLFNSCFLLALHLVAANHELPIPTFAIIDTPMKNIDKEVNQDLFRSFYNYLYKLANTKLQKTQFVIVDNNFVAPPPDLKLRFFERYMTDDDDSHPPLIRYYRGA